MTFDTHAIYAVTKRLIDMAARPALFNDRMPPARVVARLDRVLSWLGPGGRLVVSEFIRRREAPARGGKRWWRRDQYRPYID